MKKLLRAAACAIVALNAAGCSGASEPVVSTDGHITFTDMSGYERNDLLGDSMGIDNPAAAYSYTGDAGASIVILYNDDDSSYIFDDVNDEKDAMIAEMFSSLLDIEMSTERTTLGGHDTASVYGEGDFDGDEMSVVMTYVSIADYVYILQGQCDSTLADDMKTDMAAFITNMTV